MTIEPLPHAPLRPAWLPLDVPYAGPAAPASVPAGSVPAGAGHRPAPPRPLATPTGDAVVAEPLDAAVALGFRLLDAADATALAFGDLGDIDLPAPASSAADQARLRAVAPLYLAAELELAQLVPAVETLAGIVVSGGIDADVGDAAPQVVRFWQARNARFTAGERQAFHARLFGASGGATMATGASNTAFESLLIDTADALNRYGNGEIATDAAVRAAAGALAANLVPRSGGMTSFAARDLLEAVREALAILALPDVRRALGVASTWDAVTTICRRYRRSDPPIAAHVNRGKAGQLIVAWLAESLPALGSYGGRLVEPDAPVVAAAAAWLRASLALHEGAA